MPASGPPNKGQRFEEFLRRLTLAPPAASAEEAFTQVTLILNMVEDELTDIPFNPGLFRSDGRMYPPQEDHAHAVDGHPEVTRYRSSGHNTFLGSNGAIEIRRIRGGHVDLAKHGADGRGVWEQ